MKKNLVPLLASIAIVAILLVSCSNAAGPGGSNAVSVVSGTITVPDSSYWAAVKIGVFSGGTAGAYPGLTSSDQSAIGISSSRLTYYDTVSVTPVSIPPVGGTSYSITGSGATSRSYNYELPSTIPGPDIMYYFAAWYDGVAGNGNLDLVPDPTMYPSGVVAGSEHNRLSMKSTTNNSGAATTIAIEGFSAEQDLSGKYTGNYKYIGHDDSGYNEQLAIDTTTNTGFNFNISANSGW